MGGFFISWADFIPLLSDLCVPNWKSDVAANFFQVASRTLGHASDW